MKNLLIALFAVVALSACGGPLEDADLTGQAVAQPQELHSRGNDVVRIGRVDHVVGLEPLAPRRDLPLPADPRATIEGQAPELEFDFSDGRINARLNAPDFAAAHLYSVEHQSGRCTCHH